MAKPNVASLKATLDRAVADLRAEAAALAKRHAALVEERKETARALVPLEECIANARRLVDESHERQVRERGVAAVVRPLSGRLDETGMRTDVWRSPELPPVSGELEGRVTLRDLVLIAPDLVKAGLERVCREAQAKHGLSLEARARRLAEIDAEMADCAAQHEAVVEAAAGVGTTIAELPHVKAQRAYEQSRASVRGELLPGAGENPGALPVTVVELR